MQCFGNLESRTTLYWCPRCGTVKLVDRIIPREEVDTPKLPKRVSKFLEECVPLQADSVTFNAAWRIGLYESCMVNPQHPDGRPAAFSKTVVK
jgi:hypothetical protein